MHLMEFMLVLGCDFSFKLLQFMDNFLGRKSDHAKLPWLENWVSPDQEYYTNFKEH